TTLWAEGLAAARTRSMTVLSCRPAESEASMSFTALSDLAEGLLDEVIPHLPAPQGKALEIALLRAEEGDAVADRRTVSVAFLGMIRHLAATDPLLIAIDDEQWLDGPSARVLEFAFRRLRDERVGMLITQRTSR